MSEASMGAAEAVAGSGDVGGTPPSSASPAAGAVDTPTAGGQVPAAGTASPPPAQAWHEGFTPEMMAKSEAKGWKTPADAVNAYMGVESKLGVDPSQYIALPTGKEDLAGILRLRQAIGVPETPDGYDTAIFGFEEGAASELLPHAIKWAHAASLNQDQFETFVNSYAEYEAASTAETTEALRAQNQEQLEKVLGEWGEQADENLARVKRFVEKNGFDAGQLEYGMGSEQFLKLGLAVDLATGEHMIGDRGGVVTQLGPTTEQKIQGQIDTLYQDASFMAAVRANKNGPEQKRLTDLHNELWGDAKISQD